MDALPSIWNNNEKKWMKKKYLNEIVFLIEYQMWVFWKMISLNKRNRFREEILHNNTSQWE